MSELRPFSELHGELHRIWRDTPVSLQLPLNSYNIVSQENRQKIVDIMRVGRKIDGEAYVHCFTGPELHEMVIEILQKTSRLSNTYHHLKILKDEGFVNEHHLIIEGKHVKYYARTAKLYFFVESDENIIETSEFKNISDMIVDTTDIDREAFDENFVKIQKEFMKFNNQFLTWMETNHEKILNYDIDVRMFASFMQSAIPIIYGKNSTIMQNYLKIVEKILMNE